MKRILIVGGGCGGLYTALGLEKSLAGASGVEITLVNRENFFLFTPMLHEIAASDLDFMHSPKSSEVSTDAIYLDVIQLRFESLLPQLIQLNANLSSSRLVKLQVKPLQFPQELPCRFAPCAQLNFSLCRLH